MTGAAAKARLQQQVEELCAASIRALAGEADLHFRGRRLHRGRRALPLFAPHLHPSLDGDDFGSFRGAADGLALRLRHSDAALHRRLAPAHPLERLVFDLLEQFRVEAMADEQMPGVVRNLRHRFEAWSTAFHRSGMGETVRGLTLFTLAQIARARVTGQGVLEEAEDAMEVARFAFAPRIGHDLAGLRRERADQAAYARHALAIARTVGELLRADGGDANPDAADSSDDDDADAAEANAFRLIMEVEPPEGDGIASVTSGASHVFDEAGGAYQVFTRAYDREQRASSLVRAARLDELREQLDRRIAGQGLNQPRLARELRALLATPQRDGWEGGRDEGYIDGRRLAQLVASPTERRLFRVEREEPRADCVLAFLVDCSGSMRAHAESVAMLIDVFARALEQAGAACEVLGFTTGAWNGGRARRDWLRAGRPRHPGRLNEVSHLVFKDADTPWRRARRDIAALMKDDLFREGVDGEAVDWACARLAARDEARKLLVVVSDGCPMDGATNLANDPYYLDAHLRDVVERHEAEGRIAIHGLGVGLDLSPYYGRSQALDLSVATGNEVFRDLLQLIGGHRRR